MSKPEVKYSFLVEKPVVGSSAVLFLAGPHHKLGNVGQNPVYTSKVVALHENDSFETLNTMYVKS